MNKYFEERRHLFYYKYVRTLLGMCAFNAESILDVGSGGTDMISWLPCREKFSIDMKAPLSENGVEGIKANFLEYDFERKFDVVTCFQVLEHIDDDHVCAFADKLMRLSEKLLIVSVPYLWEEGACKWHVQDPVDESKFASWFNVSDSTLKPIFSRVIHEGDDETVQDPVDESKFASWLRRLVVVFVSSDICDRLSAINESDNWLIRYV